MSASTLMMEHVAVALDVVHGWRMTVTCPPRGGTWSKKGSLGKCRPRAWHYDLVSDSEKEFIFDIHGDTAYTEARDEIHSAGEIY